MKDQDIFDFFNGFKTIKPTKEELTRRYVQGYITRDEYIKKMKEVERWQKG